MLWGGGAGVLVTSDKAGSFLGITGNVSIHLDKRKPAVQNAVIRFLGVPYAKPPIGDLRFRRPEPLDKLKSAYNATFQRPFCPQYRQGLKFVQTSENCLVMNIYVPGNEINVTKAYPVMIWIHGDNVREFSFGGAYPYSGDVISTLGNVIVVVVQYRLNVFGFLSDGTAASGNFGLWDQKMAIQWIHDNIRVFGGDSTSVTLFGQSAGGVSVLFQALHPGNAGLFSRVIAESASPLATEPMTRKAGHNFKFFAALLGCNTSSTAESWDCMRAKELNDILWYLSYLRVGPILDGDFIVELPLYQITRSGISNTGRSALAQFASIDLLTGVTSSDGAMSVMQWDTVLEVDLGVDINKGVPRDFFTGTFLPVSLHKSLRLPVTPSVLQAVIHEYTDWKSPEDAVGVRGKMIDFSVDYMSLLPAVTIARTHSNLTEGTSRRTFLYEFDHKPSFDPLPAWLRGAKHGAEVPFVFGFVDEMNELPGIPPSYLETFKIPDEENYLALVMLTMWTNFAKTG
ncbi:neuroligin-1-like [Dreissena polymorpha]|nr:neuroligin-1-like [Dreissena polymorpha]